jgi:hypothetical protein
LAHSSKNGATGRILPSSSLNAISLGRYGVTEPSGSMRSDTAGSIIVSLASWRVLASAQQKLASGVAPLPRRPTAIGGRKKISRILSTG